MTSWSSVDFGATESDEYPARLEAQEQWMGRLAGSKQPFAYWADKDHPEADPDKDARFKWGLRSNYVGGDEISLLEDEPDLGGRVFIQREDDPFAFVDGDDVRDPETGDVHPEFIEILGLLGETYGDVSTSGAGVHAYYVGDLPGEQGQATFQIDDEPFRGNEDPPSVEIYANKHVCVTTGEHLTDTPGDANRWDSDAVETILELYDARKTQDIETGGGLNLDDHDPHATDRADRTGDPKDIAHAVDNLRPGDVPLKSRQVGTDSGWEVWDPSSYRTSASGESLHRHPDESVFHDHKHGESFGALSLFASEQGIISKPWDRLEGDDWWRAVDEARDAGADIPEYVPEPEETVPDLGTPDNEPTEVPDSIAAPDDTDTEDDTLEFTPGTDYNTAAPDPVEDPATAYDAPEHEDRLNSMKGALIEDDPGGQDTEAETDGGAAVDTSPSADPPEESASFGERVQEHIREAQSEVISNKQARHEIAREFDREYSFLYPEASVQGWPNKLHVYDKGTGVYQERGEALVSEEFERIGGAFATNSATREVTEKLKRRNLTDSDLQPHPARLVVANGILDLRDGTLYDHRAEPPAGDEDGGYHRRRLDIPWNPDAGRPEEIEDFIGEVVGDPDDERTLIRLISSCLWRATIEDKAGMLIGSGQNGKSVFINIIKEFLGGTDNVASKELHELTDYKFARRHLIGKMANLATEVGDRKISHTTYFKKLTSGDPDQAPEKHEESIPFENHATMLFATNEMPQFGEDNKAIWRRWVPVEFPYTFDRHDPEAKDPVPERVLERRLHTQEEFEGLLVRCQQELERWWSGEPLYKDAMTPDEVRSKMKAAAEPVFSFAEACLERGDPDNDEVPKATVRKAYREYAETEDLPRIPRNEFGERLIGLRDYRVESGQVSGGETVYRGVRLSPVGRQMAGLDDPEDEDQEQMSDIENARGLILEQLGEICQERGTEPVPISTLSWALRDQLSEPRVEQEVEKLKKKGEIIDPPGDDGIMPAPAR